MKDDGWRDVAIGGAIAALYAVLLLATVDQLGYARDEGFYFHAASVYEQWFALWGDGAMARVDEFWRVNAEHPALIKSLFALSHALFGDVFAHEGTSFRLPAILLSSAGVGLVYLWGARAAGQLAGVVAAVSLAAMPRFFYHAHLACFDAPVVTMWLLCAYVWWRSLTEGGWLRAVLVGVAFGLALNTKHNSWFLPFVFTMHAVVSLHPWVDTGEVSRRTLAKRAALSLLALATIGPLLFYATWPWIWHDTFARLAAYAKFHLQHVYYNMEFLGDNYWQPPMPRGYAFVMTAATVPAITLLCFAAGAVVSLRKRISQTHVLWLGAIGVQYGAWLLPTTPIFGGTKHWMTAYPFIVLFAGVGVAFAVRQLERRRQIAFATLVLIAPIVETAHAHPWALSSYSPLVGGAAGGANLGLNRGFWGYQTGAIADYLNDHTPRRGRVFLHDTARSSWRMLKRDGRIREDIIGTLDAAESSIAIYHHELHMLGVEYQAWHVFDTVAPDHIAGLAGVPVIWTYRKLR